MWQGRPPSGGSRGRSLLPLPAPGGPTSGLAGPSLRSRLHPILTRLRRRARPCPRSAFLFKDTGPWTQGHAHPNRTCPDPGPAAHWLTGAWPASRPLVPSCKMGMLSPLRGPWGGANPLASHGLAAHLLERWTQGNAPGDLGLRAELKAVVSAFPREGFRPQGCLQTATGPGGLHFEAAVGGRLTWRPRQ